MKKDNLRIKEDINILDQKNAIEMITTSAFMENGYTPYYVDDTKLAAIMKFFITGYELDEEDNLYQIIYEDEEVRDLILKFFENIDDTDEAREENKENAIYINILNNVMNNVVDKIEFEKQKMIHLTDKKEEFLIDLNSALESITETFAKASQALTDVDSETKKTFLSVLTKLDTAKLLNKNTITDVISDIANKKFKDVENVVMFKKDKENETKRNS